jgi:hypothetical protein
MSRNKENRIRFGVLDAVILIVVIAVAASMILRYTADSVLFGYKTETYTVTFKASGVRYSSVDVIATESELFVGNGKLLGRFTHSPTVTPMLTYESDNAGNLIACYYPDNTLVDIITEIECELIDKNGSVMTTDGVHIAPGVELEVSTRFVDLTVEIVKVEKQTVEQ